MQLIRIQIYLPCNKSWSIPWHELSSCCDLELLTIWCLKLIKQCISIQIRTAEKKAMPAKNALLNSFSNPGDTTYSQNDMCQKCKGKSFLWGILSFEIFGSCLLHGISKQSVKSNFAPERIWILIFAAILGPMCSWDRAIYA